MATVASMMSTYFDILIFAWAVERRIMVSSVQAVIKVFVGCESLPPVGVVLANFVNPLCIWSQTHT